MSPTPEAEVFPDLVASSTSIPAQVARAEELGRISRAASWCREEDVALIVKHLLESRSHEEIAGELGIMVATARQRYCRAVRKLTAAVNLMSQLDRSGIRGVEQDAIGLYRFGGSEPPEIAVQLLLPEPLVRRWIAQAESLLLESTGGPP